MPAPELKLKDTTFQELMQPEGLRQLDKRFLDYLELRNRIAHGKLLSYRLGKLQAASEVSALLIEAAPILEEFVAELFAIEEDVARLRALTLVHNPIFAFKKYFVLRLARRAKYEPQELLEFNTLYGWLNSKLSELKINNHDPELAVAEYAQSLLLDEKTNQQEIDKVTMWCYLAMHSEEGKRAVLGWQSFKLPAQLNYENLVTTRSVKNDFYDRIEGPHDAWRYRDGFKLTDSRMSEREALDEIHYCVYCHKNEGDFCSKGFPVKKNTPKLGLKINPVGEVLTGCPLEEKISEMHTLKKDGFTIGALAIIMIDNPMCAVTGHRICNDCMKACIYQKQDPVNIPQTETRVLTDVLHLPWGVEVYDLFMRWNPLRQTQYVAKDYNSLKVLVMGMGPAGFTLAHHLLMEGFAVVGTEGLKTEPLPEEFLTQPIYRYQDLHEELDDRVMAGFGGVAEYGITVRWDKNFLKLIYISLMRRPHFQVFGSVRFGGTLKVEDAWNLGFDHLALAVGAGLPRELRIPNSLAPGMRQANDFLMALQLTGAAKSSSLANLQVRLPAVVIGGGLTGIDTATEVQAYYIAQVEKTLNRYEKLSHHLGEIELRKKFTKIELEVLDEFIQHGFSVRDERSQAKLENRQPNFIKLIRRWGGVTIAYRRSMQESPAYKRNHEEVIKALEEGIYYAEGLQPEAVVLDEKGYVSALKCRSQIMDEEGKWMRSDEQKILPARAIFVATGATPNIAYEYEHRNTFLRRENEYVRYDLIDDRLEKISEKSHVKMPEFGAFTSYEQDHHRVSFLGDTHPIFHGSVVKAIASAKRTYPKIVDSLKNKITTGSIGEYEEFCLQMENLFRAKVMMVKRHNAKVVELKVKAPMAARHFAPGQFYRVQNYERLAAKVAGTRLQTEALAVIGVTRPQEPDVLSFFVLEKGASSRLVATFKPEQHISVMGPTGARIKLLENKKVMIVGGAFAIAHLLSLGPHIRACGNEILFVGYFDSPEELFCRKEIENAANAVIWVTKSKEKISTMRSQDRSYSGDIVSSLREYALQTEPIVIALNELKRVYVVGDSALLRTMQNARHALLQEHFANDAEFLASVYGPMQCMLKGVCAQCLQWQIDPETGKRTKAVYACSWQNQPIQLVDFGSLDERLAQNRVQERLTNLWLDYVFGTQKVSKI